MPDANAVTMIRGLCARFRKEGMAYQGATADLGRLIGAAETLCQLYEQRTSHLEDVIEERGRYADEVKHLRRALVIAKKYP